MEGNRDVGNEFTHIWSIAFEKDMKTRQQVKKKTVFPTNLAGTTGGLYVNK